MKAPLLPIRRWLDVWFTSIVSASTRARMNWHERFQTSRFVEIASVLLMSMATFLSAWCAFEASVWSGRQSFAMADAAIKSRLATQSQLEGNQRLMIDLMQFIPYFEAITADKEQLSRFYRDRFRPELRAATDAWLATKPLETEAAPPSPFAMPQFSVPQWQASAGYAQESADKLIEAQQDNFNSDTYILITVMLSLILFSGGVTPKLTSSTARSILLGLGGMLFAASLTLVLLQPRAFAVRPAVRGPGSKESGAGSPNPARGSPPAGVAPPHSLPRRRGRAPVEGP
jgi:hypothetical protein